MRQIRSGKVDFYTAAENQFLATVEHAEPSSSTMFAVVQRGQVPAELGEAIFAAVPGAVLDPLCTDAGYAILRALSFAPARLDERTWSAIQKILFEAWLAERRQAATIEWYWGNANRTIRQPELLMTMPPLMNGA